MHARILFLACKKRFEFFDFGKSGRYGAAMTWDEAVSAWFVFLRVERNRNPKTIESYAHDVRRLVEFAHACGIASPETFSREDAQRFLTAASGGIGPRSRARPRVPSAWKPGRMTVSWRFGRRCMRWCSTRPPVAMPLAELEGTFGPRWRERQAAGSRGDVSNP